MTDRPPDIFYAATAVPHEQRPQLLTDVDTGVCIVGGGFAGLWTARALARYGYDVVVLEGRRIAGSASGRNGGFVSAGYAERLPKIIERVGLDHARSLYALSREGIEQVRAVLSEGIPGVDPAPGRLHVLRYDDAEGLRREAALLGEQFDHDMRIWPTEEVRQALVTDRYFQALHDAEAFSIHPLNLALALAAEIERLGGRIYEQTVATAADLDGVRKWVQTSGGRVRTHQVVLCGSALIGEGFPALAQTVLPVATYVCVTAPIADKLAGAIRYSGAVSDTRRSGDYYRIVGDRLLWGGRITTRIRRPRRLARLMARDIARVYPQLKGVAIDYAWSGLMGYAIHKMPQIGQLRQGVWIASAFGGHGLNTTAMAGELIATAIADRDDRWRLFIPFGMVWAGGEWGRRFTQLVHWGMKLRDKIDETRARAAERRRKRKRLAAEEASRRAEELAAKAAARDKERAERARKGEEMSARLAAKAEEAEKRGAEAEKPHEDEAAKAEADGGAKAATAVDDEGPKQDESSGQGEIEEKKS